MMSHSDWHQQFQQQWALRRNLVDESLARCLPSEETSPEIIHRAMRYSVFAGGKRLRGILLVAVAEALGFDHPQRYLPGCAVELIHTFSLVHDDLPAMDDDDLRRGQPTCHKVFGEALGILAGDALLTYAFQLLARYPEGDEYALIRCRVADEIARAAGTPEGMVAGQVLDITSTSATPDQGLLEDLHRRKTGAMIRGAVRAGAILGAADEAMMAAFTGYSEALGLAFQITDDILDITATPEELGKTPGKDADQAKLTFPAVYGLEQSRAMAGRCVEEAQAALAGLPTGFETEFLRLTARYILERRS